MDARPWGCLQVVTDGLSDVVVVSVFGIRILGLLCAHGFLPFLSGGTLVEVHLIGKSPAGLLPSPHSLFFFMRYTQLFGRPNKSAPHDADSVNARLLVQAGFVRQEMAGVYAWLPLGLRVLRSVEQVIREEMNALGAHEVLLPALQSKEHWDTTGRWDTVDVLFKVPSQTGKQYALGPTAEEVMTPLVQQFVQSYKDLPLAVYQISSKFRDELRAKSGVLRGREFGMKDMYSFHTSTEDFQAFYDRVIPAYLKIYQRCGLQAKVVEASGGSFTKKRSHEFQVLTPAGEDKILTSDHGTFAQNIEVADLKEGDVNPENGELLSLRTGVEVGNIFDLSSRFSESFNFEVTDADGKRVPVTMGCYGIGTTRLVGTIVEACHDERGIVWPKQVAPYPVHLISLLPKDATEAERVSATASALYDDLERAGFEPLWDERTNASAGEKFADADMIGLPVRIVISAKTLAEGAVEWKLRQEASSRLIPLTDCMTAVETFMNE